ncbi:MAG: hypothetical protein ACTSVK_08085 [Promethearchaeota archaeon]
MGEFENNNKSNESVMLARMRTLLALERNFLAEERTALAEFRTGLALVLIGPPTSIIYFSSSFHFEAELWMNIILYFFLGILVIWGLLMVVRAYKKAKILHSERMTIKDKEKIIIEASPVIQELLKECMFKEDNCED